MAKKATGFSEERQVIFGDQPVAAANLREVTAATDGDRLKVGPGGRIVIPAGMRQAMGVEGGDTLLATLVDGELRLLSGKSALERARALVRASIPAGVSLVDELFAERRREIELDERRGR